MFWIYFDLVVAMTRVGGAKMPILTTPPQPRGNLPHSRRETLLLTSKVDVICHQATRLFMINFLYPGLRDVNPREWSPAPPTS